VSDGQAAYPVEAATAHRSLRADALVRLRAWPAPDAAQAAVRDDFVAHLEAQPAATAKAGPAEHLTASCLVLSQDGTEVLLTHHRRARMWFQFGGHLEAGDVSLPAAAAREAREESGIRDLAPEPQPVHLNRHVLVGDFGRCREHLDVRFVAVVPRGTPYAASEESLDVRWWPADRLPEGSPEELRELVAAARSALVER
jgi:8-oxo-dGTP pyrophosphatase MutT (NUDIX family)